MATQKKNRDKQRTALAATLRELRESKQITQTKMAEDLNMNRPEVIRFEAGGVKVIDTYIRVAEYLGLELNLFKVVNDKSSKASKYE